ncbi:MAG TPA: CHAP domain-containing protein [Solirubrobacterales bacterium]|nr:CHAP domain-containing protein [Solirubrobacterales bacterium]
MRRGKIIGGASGGLGLAALVFLVGLLSGSSAAAPPSSQFGVQPVLKTHPSGRYELDLSLSAVTRPGALCSASVRKGKQKVALPAVKASKGAATWTWVVSAGAPSGRWKIRTSCSLGRRHSGHTLRPILLVPPGPEDTSLLAPGSLAITQGKPVRPLHHEGRVVRGGRHGGRGSGPANPGYWGYCTWGAWNLARWLGGSVHGDAKYWYPTAKAAGLPTGSVPVPGAVFVRTSGDWGHVGVVVKVIDATTFQTKEMNGGSHWVNPALGKTDEFGVYRLHIQHTGPDMKFIYKPGTQPGAGKPTPSPDSPGPTPTPTPTPPSTGGKDGTAPSTPGSPKASSATTSSLNLSWTASTDNVGVAGYGLYRNGSRIATTTSSGYKFSGLSCGSSYKLGVDAYDAAGNRSAVASVTASTSACPKSVTVSKGAHVSVSGCSSSACAYVTVKLNNFGSGSHTVTCYADYPPPTGSYYQYTTSSSTSNVCVYGYSGTHVWVTVDGVESNHLTW